MFYSYESELGDPTPYGQTAGQSLARLQQPLLAMLMDELAYGVMVLGEKSQILLCNRAAKRELDNARLIAQRDQRLYTKADHDGKHLREALEEARKGRRTLVELVDGAIVLSVVIIPAPDAYDAIQATSILLFAKPAICEPATLSLFCRCHKLTKTEEQVLAVLCLGYSTPEIAEQLRVAVSTVRTHVRSLCAKTGSSGVRALVNQVAVLPPVAASAHLAPVH